MSGFCRALRQERLQQPRPAFYDGGLKIVNRIDIRHECRDGRVTVLAVWQSHCADWAVYSNSARRSRDFRIIGDAQHAGRRSAGFRPIAQLREE